LRAKGTTDMVQKAQRGDRGIIQPRRARGDPSIGPDALMVMIPSELSYLVRMAGADEVAFSEKGLYRMYLKTVPQGPPLTIAGPFIGAPHAVIAMEKLIVLGARRIWVLGWCGSLQKGIRIGHIVIPTGAVPEEGTSPHYPVNGLPVESDAQLNGLLEGALNGKGLPFTAGTVWTTDAIYRETGEKVTAFGNRGVLAVEMEMSALMTLAIYRRISMAGVLVVSDELFDLTWRPGFSNALLRDNSRAAGSALMDLALSMSRKSGEAC
jgi:uridine phosphorylase